MALATMNTKSKFCFYAMYKNESKNIIKSLESVYPYIDYWVIQDNGSTDGTQELIRNFFTEKGIPGFLYELDWWKGAGVNAEHLVRTACEANHGCDWLLRIDADEIFIVDEGYNWSVFDDTSIDSFLLPAQQDNYRYVRLRILNPKRNWRFNPEKAHETPFIEGLGNNFSRIALNYGIRNEVTREGFSYTKPMKYLVDALQFEIDLIPSQRIKENTYHLWYLGKSYNDTYRFDKWNYPFPQEMTNEYARRTIFYFELYLKYIHNFPNYQINDLEREMGYVATLHRGRAYDWLGDEAVALKCYDECTLFCPERNEHNLERIHYYWRNDNWIKILEIANFLLRDENVMPFEKYNFIVDIEGYRDTSCKPLLWKIRALYNLKRYDEIEELSIQMRKFNDFTDNDDNEINTILEEIKK